MKKIITPFLILVVILFTSGILLSQQNGEDTKFQKLVDSYMDAYWKFYPTSATKEGFHKYDGKLEDFSSKNLEKRQEELDKFNQELITKIDRAKLSEDLQIDHEMIIDGLDLDLLRHERIIPWEYNPVFYNDIINNCIRSLLQDDSISAEAQAKSIADRLKTLPKFLKGAKENLKTPSQLFTQTAIDQFSAILSFYKNDLAQWAAQAPAAHKAAIEKNFAKAIPELEAYANFLKNELLPRSTGTFMLGEAHPRLIRDTLQNTLPLQDLVARAKADVSNIRREMFLCCMALYKIMDPKINIEQPPSNLTEEQLKNHVIGHVLDMIKNEHVSKDGFLNAVKNSAKEVKEFIKAKDFCSLPPEDMAVESMPAEIQGKKWIRLITPGLYKTDGTYTLQIAPFDSLNDEQISSLLEEYNNFLLPFWTIQNVYPGLYVPTYMTRKNPSIIKKMYANGPLLQGWPLLLEETFVKSGFKNYDIRVRLNQLKYQLRAVQDFILDFNIHESGYTLDQAVAYMTRMGFLTKIEAEKKFKAIAVNPGSFSYAYIGYQEFLDMEKEFKQKQGDSFSRKAFLDELLKHGAIPIRSLKKILSQ